MPMSLSLLLVLSLSVLSGTPLLVTPTGSHDPEEVAGLVEGDIVLSDEQKVLLQNPLIGRNGLIEQTKRWPNCLVHYRIVGDFDRVHREAILAGMATLQARSCVRFEELEAEADRTDYLAITSNAGGCFSNVGYQGKRQQTNLQVFPIGEGCFRPGTILHELMHVLGFYHQQSAADRDDYVEIVYDNIAPGKEYNFKKYGPSVVTDFGVGYDYDSCLHYRPDAFSVNGKDTIVPLDSAAKIGQRIGLSKKDVDKINIMYKCPILI